MLRLFGLSCTGCAVFLAILAAGAACGGEGGDLSVTGLEPVAGATAGSQPVKILGSNFRTDIGYTVYFGNKKAPAVTIMDPETLLVLTPEHEQAEAVDVTIRADNGPAFAIRAGYRYEVQAGPTRGPGTKSGNLVY